jgi:hypothetical protein
MDRKNPHVDFINALTVSAVMAATGKSYKAVHNWKMAGRGIPDDIEVRAALTRLAKERGVALPSNWLPKGLEAA